MSGKHIPAGKFVGQIATEFNILHQWDGERWRRVEEYNNYKDYPRECGAFRFDVEDMDPQDADPLDKVFRP